MPGKKKRAITLDKGSLTVMLTSHPTKGKANKELIGFLKEVIGKNVEIRKGHGSRDKLICVELDEEELMAILKERGEEYG